MSVTAVPILPLKKGTMTKYWAAIALVLGALLALALARYDFFGKTSVNLLVILPIALPGIVTGLALQSVITGFLTPVLGIPAGLFTIIVGHATFCIVVVFNNATARLRRMGEASHRIVVEEVNIEVMLRVFLQALEAVPGEA